MPTLDLTRRLADGAPGYPGDPPVRFDAYADVAADGYRATELRLTTHSGTHVDAPAHTEADGRTVDEFGVDAFRVDAVRLPVAPVAPRTALTPERLRAAAAEASVDPTAADLVVLDTGWAAHWGDDRYHDHPYLAPAAAEWLADAGCHVAVDALSVDPTPSDAAAPDEPSGLPAHHALLGADLFVVENLAELGGLPEGFRLAAYPLPLAGADGAPARVVAEW